MLELLDLASPQDDYGAKPSYYDLTLDDEEEADTPADGDTS